MLLVRTGVSTRRRGKDRMTWRGRQGACSSKPSPSLTATRSSTRATSSSAPRRRVVTVYAPLFRFIYVLATSFQMDIFILLKTGHSFLLFGLLISRGRWEWNVQDWTRCLTRLDYHLPPSKNGTSYMENFTDVRSKLGQRRHLKPQLEVTCWWLVSHLSGCFWLFAPKILGDGGGLWMVLCHSINAGSVAGIPWIGEDAQTLPHAKEFFEFFYTHRQWRCKNLGYHLVNRSLF